MTLTKLQRSPLWPWPSRKRSPLWPWPSRTDQHYDLDLAVQINTMTLTKQQRSPLWPWPSSQDHHYDLDQAAKITTVTLTKQQRSPLRPWPSSKDHYYDLDQAVKIITMTLTKNSKWVWSGNTTITNCRQPRGTARKSRSTITRHQEDKLSKAISSLFPIKMIAILEWT